MAQDNMAFNPNQKLTFQQMAEDHLDEVMGIEALSFTSPWSRKAYLYELHNNDFAHYIVARLEDRIVGYAGMWVLMDESHITTVAVHPVCRGRGLGRSIMAEMMRRSLIMGVTRITLEVRSSNQPARSLYASLGFVEKGLRKKYYADNNEDAVVMWAELMQEESFCNYAKMI
jgi:ribosomal-protein-alanine N-acetyltransferase